LFIALQWLIWVALWLAVGLLTFITFPGSPWYILLIAGVFLVSSFYYLAVKKDLTAKLVYASLLLMIGVNFVLDSHFYPTLLTYQSGSVAGKYIASLSPRPNLYSYRVVAHGLDYYSGKVAINTSLEYMTDHPGIWIYTTPKGKLDLDNEGIQYKIIKTYPFYHVTELTMKFLNPNSRESVLDERYLLEIMPQK